MEELINRHGAIMVRYDPEKKIGMIVDEWGTWFDVEPGTNPGFLYQQNAMRDAIVAAVNLNIFNNHCDTVVMTNIAQTVNVLQAVVLTEGDRMLLTPTYHVFEMYTGHQGAQQLECYAQSVMTGADEKPVPQLHASASRSADGDILLTVANTDMDAACPIDVIVAEASASCVSARVLSGDPHDHNTFDAPETVKPVALDVQLKDGHVTGTLPPCSVAAIVIKP